MDKVSIVIMLVMMASPAAVAVNSMYAVSPASQLDKAQNMTCDLACQEAIINEADNDDIVDRMMKECGFINQY